MQSMPKTMRAIRIANPGPDYRLEMAEEPRPVAGPGEVLIRVVAAGVNRADLLQAQGRYPPPQGASPVLGMEVAGVIVECAHDVKELKGGDQVCALVTGGGYAEFCTASAACVLRVPSGVELLHAAALPEA